MISNRQNAVDMKVVRHEDTSLLREVEHGEGAQVAVYSSATFVLWSSDDQFAWKTARKLREERGWAPKYTPPLEDGNDFREFKGIVSKIGAIVTSLSRVLTTDTIDNAIPDIAEIDSLLDALYECKWGKGESLKMIVVAVQAQIRNCRVEKAHVQFLISVGNFLDTAYLIDDLAVTHILSLIDDAGLDTYRGALSGEGFIKRYRLEEIKE